MPQDRIDRDFPPSLSARARHLAGTLGSELGLVAGTPLALWRHLRRRTPVHRHEFDAPPHAPLLPRASEASDERVQVPRDGVGAGYRRRYRIRLRGARLRAEQLVDLIAGDPNVVSPTDVASFERDVPDDDDDGLQAGEELLVRVAGPWNGPVRVVERTLTSFRLQTLRGHMEAGQIEFRAVDGDEPGDVTFEIESYARSGSRIFGALYELGPARLAQEHMWISFLDHVAEQADAEIIDGIHVETERGPGGRG